MRFYKNKSKKLKGENAGNQNSQNTMRFDYTKENMLAELNRIYKLAMSQKHGRFGTEYDLKAALEAVDKKGKLFGLYSPDKQETKILGDGQDFSSGLLPPITSL